MWTIKIIQPRLEKKVRVAFDWTLDLLFAKDIVHFIIFQSAAISTQEETAASKHLLLLAIV